MGTRRKENSFGYATGVTLEMAILKEIQTCGRQPLTQLQQCQARCRKFWIAYSVNIARSITVNPFGRCKQDLIRRYRIREGRFCKIGYCFEEECSELP